MTRPLTFGSVCSGIEAASLAWGPLGWRPAFLSEIEAFPREVLKHRHPTAPLHGDFTTIQRGDYEPIDLLVGGTPCQSFSVAGLRGGLADERGNLALEFLRLADRLRPCWLVWENVPGVLSSSDGRDFGAFLGGLAELGYGFAWRVLDAQFFGLAQRRKRVFVVGYLGDWRRAAAVLFERASLRRDSPPRRQAGQGPAGSLAASTGGSDENARDGRLIAAYGGNDTSGPIDVATARNAHGGPHGRLDFESETFIAHAAPESYRLYTANDDVTEAAKRQDTVSTLTGRAGAIGNSGTNVVVEPLGLLDARQSDVIQYGDFAGPLDTDGHSLAICFSAKDHADAGDIAPTIRAGGHSKSHANAGVMPAVAFALRGREDGAQPEMHDDGATVGALRHASGGSSRDYLAASSVRRLTPRECERLQGFPDDYTLIPWRGGMAPDGPRYKALGNSMAVPVMAWIGRRVAAVDALDGE